MELSESPTSPQSVSLQLSRLKDIFHDPRKESRPSRFVRAFVGTSGATSLARNDEGTRCVVAGAQSLKIIRTQDPDTASSISPPPRSAKLLATGAGCAQLYEDINMWAHGRPTENYLMTDVSWGTGNYSNKIVTACSSGDIVLWDVHKASSKIERVFRKEHKRSATCVMFAPLMPGVFMTGSQDTTVKVFDLRNKGKTRTFNHSTTVRSIAFSPFQPTSTSPFNDILVATEGGDIFRWDIRSPDKPMDRVLAAHKGAILGIDWIVGGERGNLRSWVCTGGVDRAVKVWDVSASGIPNIPHHTLRTPHPVKQVAWRPSSLPAFPNSSSQQHLTELLVIPRTVGVSPFGVRGNVAKEPELLVREAGGDDIADCDKDRPGIWDVRRHHVPKYVLLGGEGAVADAVWTASDTVCTVYRSGAFVRHDVACSYAPLYDANACAPSITLDAADSAPSDPRNGAAVQAMVSGSMNRHALAWDPMGGIAFASGPMPLGEIPFDDVPPAITQLLNLPPKSPADGVFESTQVTGHVPGQVGSSVGSHAATSTDLNVLRHFARNYQAFCTEGLTTDQICKHNAEVAMNSGDVAAAQLWDRMRTLLCSRAAALERSSFPEQIHSPAPATPLRGSKNNLPSAPPRGADGSHTTAPLQDEQPHRPLVRTPSTSMIRTFAFGMPAQASNTFLDRIAPLTPTASPTHTPPPSASSQNSNDRGRSLPANAGPSPRRMHARTVSATARPTQHFRRSLSPAPRTPSSRSLSRLGRRASRPKAPLAIDTAQPFDNAVHRHSPLETSYEAIPRLDSTELRRKNGIIPIADSTSPVNNYSPRHTEYPVSSPHRPRHSISRSPGHYRDYHVSTSSGGRSQDTGTSRSSTAGGSGNRSRSHSSASTTAFLALQDDISESSEGDLIGHHVHGENRGQAGSVNQPPSPIVSTAAPIVPSPLSQTMVASSPSEARAGPLMSEALARVDEVAEPSSFRSVLTITARSEFNAGPSSVLISTTLDSSTATSARRSREFSFRLPEEDSFASDDAIDADDNYDPASSAEDDIVDNSPRPSRLNRDLSWAGGIPEFKLDAADESDGNGRLDDNEDSGEPYLSRQFSESSVKTAVPLRRIASGVAEGMYTSFRLQRSSNAGTRSRYGSSVSKAPARSRSISLPRSSRPRAFSNATSGRSLEGANDNGLSNHTTQSNSEPVGKPDREDRSRSQMDADSFRGRQERHRQLDTLEAEQHIRSLAWSKFRERVEDEIEAGNVQLASLLVLVGGEQVLNDRHRSETLVESYIAYLSHLRLHTSAAMLRKEAAFRRLRDVTLIDTTIYTSCGRCHKSLTGLPQSVRYASVSGGYQYCYSCREHKARCEICHLPVNGLHFFCQGCSHGGHQECYRKYITSHPLSERRPGKAEAPPTPEGATTIPRARSFAVSGVSSRISTAFGPSPAIASLVDIQQQLTRDSHNGPSPPSVVIASPPSEEGSRSDLLGPPPSWLSNTNTNPAAAENRNNIRYYPCASGCGHYCWAVTI